jgi:hypothetical protein
VNLLVHRRFPMSAIIACTMYNVRAARRVCYSSPVSLLELAPKGSERRTARSEECSAIFAGQSPRSKDAV